jgi:hypothetical protein
MFVAVSACAGTSFAQAAATVPVVAAEPNKMPDSLGCLTKCAAQGVFCAGDVAMPTACESIAECKDTHIFKDALVAFCTACSTGESSCTDALPPITVKPQPAAKPVEGGIQKAGRIKRLTTEYMCSMSGGVMLEVFVGFDPKKQEVALRQECRKSGPFLDVVLQRAADKLPERPSAVKAVPKPEEAKLKSDYEDEPAVATPPGPNPNDWERAQPNVFGPDQGDALANLNKAQEEQAAAQQAQAKALAELNTKVALEPSGFGLQFNAAAGIHVLRPYGQKLFTVGGELLLMPALTDTWRLALGLGGAYAGQDNDDDHMGMVAPYIGLEKRFQNDVVYLGFGALAEVRMDDTGRAEFGSYGAQLKPQFCFGQTSKACLNVNVALMATHFYGQKTDVIFWDVDAVFGAGIGGRFGR